MSPHVDDRFVGHIEQGDPRTPFFGCAGCTWPTIPPYRYLLASTTATGVLVGLNTRGILLEITAPPNDPRNMQWDMIDGPLIILDAFALKNEQVDPYGWSFSGVITTPLGVMEWLLTFPEGRCNVGIALPNIELADTPAAGTTGTDFQALQVEHDQMRPPGGWPP